MTNWRKSCRACLKPEDSFKFLLFKNVSAEEYSFCTSVVVHEHEDLPKGLCESCNALFQQFTHFKRMCLQSQESLLELKCGNVKIELDIPGSANIYEDVFNPDSEGVKEEDSCDNSYDDIFEKLSPIKDIKNKNKKRPPKKSVKLKRKYKIRENGTKNKQYSCELCNKSFVCLNRYEAHKLRHEGKIAPIHCLACNKTFSSQNGLKRHNANEHSVVRLISLKCHKCGKICKSPDSLRIHVKQHENATSREFICDVCGRKFKTKMVLQVHLETHKENRERSFTCEHCGKKFYSNAALLSHVSRRHTCRRYICDTCGYPFTQKYNLMKHILIHQGKKLYTCDICQKSYGAQSTLTEHKRTHSGERPFPCNYCPKRFLSRRRLKDHHLTHTGEKPHKCKECEQSFSQRGTLTRHMKVHERQSVL